MITPEILVKPVDKGKEVFIADTARIFGKVKLGDETSVWFGAVIRGDRDNIAIGNKSNIQDNAIIHADPGFPAIIGSGCIIGHGAIVHGATISDNVLVGIHATVLNGAHISEYCIIGAGSLVPENMIIPPFSLVMGIPAKVIKTLSEEQKDKIRKNAETYVELSKVYIKMLSNQL